MAINRGAFQEIFGDPFAKEPVLGHYQETKKSSSTLVAAKLNFDQGVGTNNPARPSITDFFCDVERVASIALTDEAAISKFTDTYINESTTTAYTTEERHKLEQFIGRLLIAYGISPVSRYFRTVRKSINRKS
jgi:hypothetical protein